MKDEKNILEAMETDIMNANIPEAERTKLMKNLLQLKKQKINLMITGATGSGKSSTINALFNTEVAKVGVGVDPETMDITKYDLDNLVLWDSPGLGDGKEADNRHANNIINKLDETDENGNLLIDLVLVILDGSTRDLGTSYELINRVIIPNLGKNKENRILVAINQADVAMASSGTTRITALSRRVRSSSMKKLHQSREGLKREQELMLTRFITAQASRKKGCRRLRRITLPSSYTTSLSILPRKNAWFIQIKSTPKRKCGRTVKRGNTGRVFLNSSLKQPQTS